MINMVTIARRYLGITGSGIDEVLTYYNKFCAPLVDSKRRYHMRHGDNWCMAFLSVVAHKAGLDRLIFPYEVSVFYACEIAKKNNCFVDRTNGFVGVGDLIIYNWKGSRPYNHVGLIASIDGGVIKTIEGNYSGTVKERTIARDNSAIQGFILLDLGNYIESELDDIARAVIRGDYGNGEERKRRLGEKYNVIQARVNKLMK